MHRRTFLRRSAATLAGAFLPSCMNPVPPKAWPRMPVLFVSHGAPTLAIDAVRGADFARVAAALPRPRAVLVVSAHWLDAPATIGTRDRRELLYDFGGFPDELYRLCYDAPAASELAAELQKALPFLARDDERPWDHGVWVPLRHMYPAADIPVLQLSLPLQWRPEQLFLLGRQLAAVRDAGVLLLASGGAVHNLGAIDWTGTGPVPAWATEFETWLRERLEARAFDDLVAYRDRAPALRQAHPTVDHFVPLLVAAGAAADRPGSVAFPITGFEYGSLSRLAVQFE